MEEETGKKNFRTVTIAIILLIVFILILILFLYLIRRPALFGSFAQSSGSSSKSTTTTSSVITPQEISFDNSYIFASPLRAATSVELVRITVYVLDGQGMGVSGQKAVLGGGSTVLHIYPVNDVTDESGRAVFDISADSSGLYIIEASVNGKKLNQKVSVNFD